jgi:hypothetical protein
MIVAHPLSANPIIALQAQNEWPAHSRDALFV